MKGYIVEVTGYADSTGSAAINTTLSESRAKAVVTILMQQGAIPVRHIVAPGAMENTDQPRQTRPRPGAPRIVGLKSKSSSTRALRANRSRATRQSQPGCSIWIDCHRARYRTTAVTPIAAMMEPRITRGTSPRRLDRSCSSETARRSALITMGPT
jgi:hypothetical protein